MIGERSVDTLPDAEVDYQLDYPGYFGCPSFCRVRVYRPAGAPTVIVLTELPENTGTSITNVSEYATCLAWYRAGQPVPVVFIEHYRGWERARHRGDQEHASIVVFPIDGDGFPARYRKWRGGPAGGETTMFGAPTWRYLTMEGLAALTRGDSL